jgi:uncharacterized protein Smg (DUF494 family)
MDHLDSCNQWWQVIEALSDYVTCGYDYEDLEDELVRLSLLAQGFSQESIESALEWLEMASNSGHVAEVFSMLNPQANGTRVASPLERVCFSEKLWQQFEKMRHRGLIGADLAERILEGMRSIDTRDWDDDEIHSFLMEVVSASLPNKDDRLLRRMMAGRQPLPEFYS